MPGFLAVGGVEAGGLRGGAVAPGVGVQGGRQAHVAGEGPGGLFADGGGAGLEAEAAQHGRAEFDGRHDLRAAGDAVAVGVVGVGEGQDVGGGDGFEQAEADHLRRDAGGEHEACRRGRHRRGRRRCRSGARRVTTVPSARVTGVSV